MTTTHTLSEFRPEEFLDSEEAKQAYLNEALKTGDVAFVAESLSVIERAENKGNETKGS